uniref:Uncharacterized protein isoform X3 n=1 Tax=Pogona vitticeps TaxID=103695 RepID=A0ABM5F299_9SAUR
MAWAVLFLALLSFFSSIRSQLRVTPPASASVSRGGTVTISCTRSSDGSWDSVFWIQQRPKQHPRFVLYGSSTRGEGIPNRFSGSASGNTGYLTITDIQADDEADYFCAEQFNTGQLFGQGSRVTVTGIRSQLRVTPPASASVSQGETVTISCIRSSDGSWDSVFWIQQRPKQHPRFVLYGSSTRGEGIPDRFNGSASGNTGYLTITNAQPEDAADYFCAEQFNTGQLFGQGSRVTVAGIRSQLRVTPPASASISRGETVTLSCRRSSDGSWDSVSWIQQRPKQHPRFVLYGSSTRGEGIPNRFSGSASGNTGYLTITDIQADDEADYFCAEQFNTGQLFGQGSRVTVTGIRSQLRVTPPASASVSRGETVTMSCTRSSDGSWDSVFWLQQRPKQHPRFVLYGSSTRGEGIPDRFSGSASGNTGYLTITNAQPEDEADYFCAEQFKTGQLFGQGSHLTITGQHDRRPLRRR